MFSRHSGSEAATTYPSAVSEFWNVLYLIYRGVLQAFEISFPVLSNTSESRVSDSVVSGDDVQLVNVLIFIFFLF